MPLPRHSHPGASDCHASPRCGSIDRLHVLPCASCWCGSSRQHRTHHSGGCSRLPGLPAVLHARFVPHLGLNSGDGRDVEKGLRVKSAVQLLPRYVVGLGRWVKRKCVKGERENWKRELSVAPPPPPSSSSAAAVSFSTSALPPDAMTGARRAATAALRGKWKCERREEARWDKIWV